MVALITSAYSLEHHKARQRNSCGQHQPGLLGKEAENIKLKGPHWTGAHNCMAIADRAAGVFVKKS